ncbi:SpaH/EbpB family LPXTG-anchored major pilin [Actinomycetaceae bacterium MB13-C1-2]|nr:SpaH/EbpB family LPXTG-anchored major pilin [Actinomycetaceae bacterium MB13-C1-2]
MSKRTAVGIGAIAAAAVGLMGIAPAAYAADPVVGNIDWDRQDASITVHKHDQLGDPAEVGKGHEITISNDPIAGVDFKLSKVDLDLSVATNWENLDKLDPKAQALDPAFTPKTLQTIDDGTAAFTGLEPGLYLVEEIGTADANVHGKKVTLGTMVAPWLMVVPTWGQTAGAGDFHWMYDVHAYPKNQVDPLKKEAGDLGGFEKGDEVTWDITAVMPMLNGEILKSYVLKDQLDENLDYVEVRDVKLDGAELVEGVDYSVDGDRTVTLSLEDSLLATITGGEKLTFTIVTVVNDNLEEGATIENEIEGSFTNQSGGEFEVVPEPGNPDPGKPGPEKPKAWVAYGDAVLTKVNSENQEVLQGATFVVFENTTANANTDCSALIADPNVKKLGSATSDSNGLVKFPLLRVGDSNDDKKATEFLICESEAPTGYILNKGKPTAILFDSERDKTATPATFENTPNTPGGEDNTLPSLPLTGAAGTATFLLVGGGLLAAGVAVRMRSKAKQN